MTPRVRVSLIVVFGVGLSACSLELPEGPDLSGLAAEYDSPDGLLDEENVEVVVEAAQASLERIEQFASLDFVVGALTQVSDSVRDFSKATPDSRRKVDISSQTVVPCPGLSGGDTSDLERGILTINLVVQASRLRSTVWGTFDACRFDPAGADVKLDAPLQIYLDGDLALSSLAVESYLFQLEGSVQVDGEEREGHLDFRVFDDGALELRVPAETGHVVMGFQVGEDQEASVRTAGGSFCCHFDERRCASVSGDSCRSSETEGTEIRW